MSSPEGGGLEPHFSRCPDFFLDTCPGETPEKRSEGSVSCARQGVDCPLLDKSTQARAVHHGGETDIPEPVPPQPPRSIISSHRNELDVKPYPFLDIPLEDILASIERRRRLTHILPEEAQEYGDPRTPLFSHLLRDENHRAYGCPALFPGEASPTVLDMTQGPDGSFGVEPKGVDLEELRRHALSSYQDYLRRIRAGDSGQAPQQKPYSSDFLESERRRGILAGITSADGGKKSDRPNVFDRIKRERDEELGLLYAAADPAESLSPPPDALDWPSFMHFRDRYGDLGRDRFSHLTDDDYAVLQESLTRMEELLDRAKSEKPELFKPGGFRAVLEEIAKNVGLEGQDTTRREELVFGAEDVHNYPFIGSEHLTPADVAKIATNALRGGGDTSGPSDTEDELRGLARKLTDTPDPQVGPRELPLSLDGQGLLSSEDRRAFLLGWTPSEDGSHLEKKTLPDRTTKGFGYVEMTDPAALPSGDANGTPPEARGQFFEERARGYDPNQLGKEEDV